MLQSAFGEPAGSLVDHPRSAAQLTGRTPQEELLGTIDAWELRHFRWPFMRALCRPYVEQRELRY